MRRAINSPIVWLLVQAALGVYLGVRWFVIVAVLMASGALLYAIRSQRTGMARSIPGSYHGKRSALVLTLTVEALALASLTIDTWGPSIGLATFRAQCVGLAAGLVVAWALYQSARKAWPAGSD
jgi:hypothetical protein